MKSGARIVISAVKNGPNDFTVGCSDGTVYANITENDIKEIRSRQQEIADKCQKIMDVALAGPDPVPDPSGISQGRSVASIVAENTARKTEYLDGITLIDLVL